MPTQNAISHLLFAKSQKPASPAKRGEPKAKGFTLIELLVVIAIIGILATFVVASFTSAQARGRDSRRKSDLDAIKKALELAKQDTPGGSRYRNSLAAIATDNYIKNVPNDPKSTTATPVAYAYQGAPCGCFAHDAAAGPYCTDFRLYATLENGNDPQRTGSGQPASTVNTCALLGCNTYVANTYVVCAP